MPDYRIVRQVGPPPKGLVWVVDEWIETTTRPDENDAAIKILREYAESLLAHGTRSPLVLNGLWERLCAVIDVEVGS